MSERDLSPSWLAWGIACVVAGTFITIFACSPDDPYAPQPDPAAVVDTVTGPVVSVVGDLDTPKGQLINSFVESMYAAEGDSVPPLITIALWLATYYPDATVLQDPPVAFHAAAPTTGSTPVRYLWEISYVVSEPPVPPELAEGLGWAVDALVHTDADSARARVAAIDAQGRQGPFSVWSVWYYLRGP